MVKGHGSIASSSDEVHLGALLESFNMNKCDGGGAEKASGLFVSTRQS